MELFHADGGDEGEVHVPVEAAVAIEIAQIGRDHFRIARVVAEHGELHFSVGAGPLEIACGGFRDIDGELVITADVDAGVFRADEDVALLSGAFEVKQGAPVGEGILRGETAAIPGGALVVSVIGIDGIEGIEAVGQRDGVPRDIVAGGFTAPDFPGAAEAAAVVFPTGGEATDGRGSPRRPKKRVGVAAPAITAEAA